MWCFALAYVYWDRGTDVLSVLIRIESQWWVLQSNLWKPVNAGRLTSYSFIAPACLFSPFKVMNMYAFPFNHYLRLGSWICFAVCTNCWGLRSSMECVDIFASEALIQKARNWKHLGVVIVWNFNMRVVPFTKACDISFSVYVACFEAIKNIMYFHTRIYSLTHLLRCFLGAQFTFDIKYSKPVKVQDTRIEREGWVTKQSCSNSYNCI